MNTMLFLPSDQTGQGLTEYALILLLVVIVVVAIVAIMGPQVGNMFSRVTNAIP
jgi:pilus assembly protein Flp/PilA